MGIEDAHGSEECVVLHYDGLARVDEHLQRLAEAVLAPVRGHEVVEAGGERGRGEAVHAALEGPELQCAKGCVIQRKVFIQSSQEVSYS